MVFDEDNSQHPRQDVKHQRHDRDDPVERKDHRSRRDQDMIDSNNRDRYGDRSRGHGGNGDNKARSERGVTRPSLLRSFDFQPAQRSFTLSRINEKWFFLTLPLIIGKPKYLPIS